MTKTEIDGILLDVIDTLIKHAKADLDEGTASNPEKLRESLASFEEAKAILLEDSK